MKKLLLILGVVIGISQMANAQQKIKFGHINLNSLLQLMPERDSASVKLQAYAKSLEDQLALMNNELSTKYQEYLTNEKIYTELIKQTKQQELQDLNKRIQNFQQTAQQDLQAKEDELLRPLYDKANKAISEVAKEQGYTYIFDSSFGHILFSPDEDNILPLVRKKMGL